MNMKVLVNIRYVPCAGSAADNDGDAVAGKPATGTGSVTGRGGGPVS